MILKKNARDPIINAMLRVLSVYLGMGMLGYLMGFEFSISADVVTGAMVSVYLNRGFNASIADSYDRRFSRFIDYRRLLPISTRGLLLSYILRYMMYIAVSVIPLILTARIVLGSEQIQFSAINPFAFIGVLLLSLLFLSVAFVSFIFIASFDWLRFNLWQRILTPSIVLGCNLYSWYKVYAFNPMIGRIFLISPVVYMTEGLRTTLLSSGTFIPAGYCMLGLGIWATILLFVVMGPIARRIDEGQV
ncbi:MAG: hypothetical protein AB7F19_01135 [Candidatus Babeliales bacterium]